MSKVVNTCFLSILCIALCAFSCDAYNVVHFGAKPNGRSDSSLSFLRAWMAACSSARPSTVYVPRGTYLLKPVTFSGSCKNRVTFHIDGTLVAPTDYWSMGNSGFWILFHEVSRVSILGGKIDGRGAGFWACRKKGGNCPVGARVLYYPFHLHFPSTLLHTAPYLIYRYLIMYITQKNMQLWTHSNIWFLST